MVNQDDILSGDSYFMTEIKSIKRLFDLTLTDHIYCFIDEIFKGTNTTERIASEAVLNYFDQQDGYTVIAATHDIELSELLDHQYSNYHFNESISGNTIDFDYKIKSGKATHEMLLNYYVSLTFQILFMNAQNRQHNNFTLYK